LTPTLDALKLNIEKLNMADVVAILLAAGESSRMGQSKALLPWQGRTLLEHQVGVLTAGGADRVIVVTGHHSQRLCPLVVDLKDVICVYNPNYRAGKTTSIQAGLEATRQERPYTYLMLNVDQPRSADTIRMLLEAHRPGLALLTIPTFRGKGGHPIIIDSSLFEEILAIEEETQGMKAVTQRHAEQTQWVSVDSPEVLWDLNTPEQYRTALAGN
jgi:molybdenum cofactor cytidylyltransferase